MEPAPAAQMMAPLAMLAQQQQQAVAAQQQQQMMMREAMKQQILRLVSMMPMANPAGVAARTEPLPPSMGENDMSPGENENAMGDMAEDQSEEMMS
jgi:hypothetical protein